MHPGSISIWYTGSIFVCYTGAYGYVLRSAPRYVIRLHIDMHYVVHKICNTLAYW
jgi:hypothetical protein